MVKSILWGLTFIGKIALSGLIVVAAIVGFILASQYIIPIMGLIGLAGLTWLVYDWLFGETTYV